MGVKRYNGIGMVTVDEFNAGLAGKLDKPDAAGNENDVLTKTADGGEVWAPVSSTGTPADSAMSDSSTNAVQNKVIKKYVDDTADTKANKDGYYSTFTAGAAETLVGDIVVEDAFLVRPTGGADVEAGDGVVQILEAKGNSVKFNQLVDTNTTTVTVTSGHKYYARISGTASVATSTGTAISVTGGSDTVIDLTAAEIADLTTVEAVEAWLAENIGAMAYYPYTTDTVLNNCMEGIAAPGYNLLDPTTGKAQIIGEYSELYGNGYGIVGTHGTLTFTDVYGYTSTITPDSDGKFELTVPGELSVASAGADCAVFLWWDGTKKEYQPYELNESFLDVKHIYGKLNGAGDLVQVWADGIPGDEDARDILHVVDGETVADKIYEQESPLRYTNLVYQGSSHFADGTPVVLPVTYKVNNWSIESIIPQNTSSALVTAPPVLTCKYSLGAVDLLNTHTDEITDLYATKADTEGSYPGIISGNLVDVNGVGTDQEFVSRPTGGGEALTGNGNGVLQAIKGRTLAWNQLFNGDFGARSILGISGSIVGGRVQFSGTPTATSVTTILPSSPATIVGHKYLVMYTGSHSGCTIAYRGIDGASDNITASFIGTAASASTLGFAVAPASTSTPISIDAFMGCIDLTAMFQAGNEPATVAEFTAIYNELYYAKNDGTILPYKGTGLKTTGVNQWDEEWELGTMDASTGDTSPATNRIRSKNFCKVLPSTAYYLVFANASGGTIYWYDINKSYIGYDAIYSAKGQRTSPAGAAFFKINPQPAYGTTYNHDICINISNPSINGQYFPYEESTLSLPIIGKTAKDGNGNPIVPFPAGMHGLPSDYDTATKDGGTIKWGVRAYEAGDESDATVITDGTNTAYLLDAPVPFTWDEPLEMVYPAPAGGTEAIIPQGVDESGVPATAPLKATIFYSKDYVQTINDMPKDFDTTASIDALASALATTLSTALNGTFSITRGAYDESAKKYAWTVTFTPDEEE